MRVPRSLAVTLALCLAGGVATGVARGGGVEDGRRLLKERRYAEAAEAFRGTLKTVPSSKDAMLGLAAAASEGYLRDTYDEVESLLQKAAKAAPEDRDLRIALGRFYMARSKDDDRYHADVEDQFRRVLANDPNDEDAVVGIGRMYFERADFKRALETLDALLATKPTAAAALYWKGRTLYIQGQDAFKSGNGSLTPEAKDLFEKAVAALDASSKADASRFDTWLELAHAAQYLAKIDLAQTAYEKAIDLDGEDEKPLQGLSALNANDPNRWAAALARLPKDHPKAPIVFYYYGFWLKAQKGRLDEAEKAFRTFTASSRSPSIGWYFLGQVLEEKGDATGARKAYEDAVKSDPSGYYGAYAVGAIEKPLQDRASGAMGNAAEAKALMRDYQPLLALAPKNTAIRNNLGFILREAFDKGGRDKALLAASIKYYEEAVALIGPWGPDQAAKPYPWRHNAAQILNDTGVMYHYYADPPDFKKAEAYYRSAQELSDSGYWDGYTNLMKILTKEARWQDAYDYALDCSGASGGASGLKNPDGSANDTWRATARGDAQRLESKIPK